MEGMGYQIPQDVQVPDLLMDFNSQYGSMQEAYDQYMLAATPEGGFQSQEELNAVNEAFTVDVQDPYSESFKSYSKAVEDQNKYRQEYSSALMRMAIPGSLNDAFSFVKKDSNVYALDKVELQGVEEYQFKLPGMNNTQVGAIRGTDLLFSMVPDKDGNALPYFESVETDDIVRGIDQAGYLVDQVKTEVVPTALGEKWMSETLDAEAIPNARQIAENIENAMAIRNSVGAKLDQKFKAIDTLMAGFNIKRAEPWEEMSNRDKRELMQEIDEAYADMVKSIRETQLPYTEKQLNEQRLVVWMDKLAKNVRENIMLSEDEFKSLYPEQEYVEYERYMELKVMEDLMTDEQSALAAAYFGEDSVKLLLDMDSAVGERNKRFNDKRISFKQGLIDFDKSLDALATAAGGFEVVGSGQMGVALSPVMYTEEQKEERERELRLRDVARDEKIQELQEQRTKYASGAELVDKFGDNALMSSNELINKFNRLQSEIKSDVEFETFHAPAIRSLPQSLSGQALGLGATVLSGGNAIVGAAVNGAWTHSLVSARSYYDTYMDPRFDDMSETQRKVYAQVKGAAEGAGEAAQFYLLASGGRIVNSVGAKVGVNTGAFGRGAYDRYRAIFKNGKFAGVKNRTPIEAIGDWLLGRSAYMGVNASGEYVAEGTTGGLGYIADRIALGERIDGEELLDVMHHDGKIGMYSTLYLGGGGALVQDAIAATEYGLEQANLSHRYNAKARAAFHQALVKSGQMSGMGNAMKAKQLREAQEELAKLLKKRQIDVTADMKAALERGEDVSGLDLNKEEQEAMDKIKALVTSQLQNREDLSGAYAKLFDEGRFDILAALMERDNADKFYDWILSFDERGITIDKDGRARLPNGDLATGYGAKMDSQYGKLSKEERESYKKLQLLNRIERRLIQGEVELGHARLMGRITADPNRGDLKSVTEQAQNGFVLFTDQDGELVGGLTEEQVRELGTEMATVVDRAIEYAKESKGQVRIVIHRDRDSFRQAVSVKGDAAYLEATQEQRDNGVQDEVHIVLDENTTELKASQDLLHEMGHFKLRDLVNNGVKRLELLEAIENLAKTDASVAKLVQAVRDNYRDYAQENLEREIINNYLQAVAFGYINIGQDVTRVLGKSKNFFGFTKRGLSATDSDVLIAIQAHARELAKTGDFGRFSKADFEVQAEHDRLQEEAENIPENQFDPTQEGENQNAMESRKLGKKFTYLENTEIHYKEVIQTNSAKGTFYTRSRTVTTTVKDYNHYRNLYAKLTGNGVAPERMMSVTYVKDGRSFNVKPPKPVIDRATGGPRVMPVPQPRTWVTKEISNQVAAANKRSALTAEMVSARRKIQDIHRASNLATVSNWEAFLPNGPYAQGDFYALSVDDQVIVLRAGLRNAKAYALNPVTDLDSRFRPNVPKWLYPKDNQDIFNRAGETVPSRRELLTQLAEGAERHGMRPWEFFPMGSEGRNMRYNSFSLLTAVEMESALDKLALLDEGLQGEKGIMDLGPDAPKGLEQRKLGKVAANRGGVGKFVYTDLPAFFEAQGVRSEDVQVSVHNLDWTRFGTVSLEIEVNGKKTVAKFQLAGGPLGAARASVLGVPMIHTNTNPQSAAELGNYTRESDEKHYMALFALLNEENSLGNPAVFNIAMQITIDYISGMEATDPRVAKAVNMLNTLFNNQASTSEFKKYIPNPVENSEEYMSEVVKMSNKFGYTLRGFLGINSTTPGITIQGDAMQIDTTLDAEAQQAAVIDVLKRLQNKRERLGFAIRGSVLDKVFQTKGGLGSQKGFVSKQQFLNAVNDPALKKGEAGDIFSASFVRKEQREKVQWFESVDEVANLPSGKKWSDFRGGMAYTTGTYVDGGQVIPVIFENVTLSSDITKKASGEVEARQRTTGLITLKPFAGDIGIGVKKGAKKSEKETEGANLESRRLLGRQYVQGQDSWTASTATPYGAVLQRLAMRLQDKYSDVMLLQQDIEVFKGNKVIQSQDFEMAMDLYYGLVRNDLEQIEGMVDEINNLAKAYGISAEDLSDFLYARHAAERNAFIQTRDASITEGSGMSDQEAQDILDRLDSPEMRNVAAKVYDMIAFTRKYMVDGGLETRKVVDEWTKRFKYYVPLNGLAEDQMDASTSAYPSGGAGMAIYGPSVRKAKGRSTQTGVNIFGNVVMQAAATVQKARKDQAMLSLYNLVKGNPNSDVWSVHGPDSRMVSMGVKLSDEAMFAREDTVPLRINGIQHFIRFKNKDYARALNGMTLEKLDFTSKQAAKYVGFLRNSYTVWNPAFFIPNFLRDLQSAVYNAAAEIDREGGILSGMGLTAKEFNKALMRTTMSSLKALLADAHGLPMDAELVAYMDEWKKAGGRTGWSYSDTLNKIVEDLNDKTVGKSRAGEVLAKIWSKSIGAVGEYVEGVNEAFENAIRLSAYIEARKAGATPQRAAQLSKNITVNFNKSGELTPSINAWFLFFNAAVQGSARFTRSFGTLKESVPQQPTRSRITAAQKMGVGMTMFSFMQTAINIMMSARDDDDELWYKKEVADYKKQRNQIIMTGPKDYITVPLPYGMNLFNNVGMIAAELALGVRDIDDGAMFLALSAQSSFSPISFGQGDNLIQAGVSTMMPTFLKPATEVAFNSTYFGGKVYQDQYPFGTEVPDYTLSFRAPEFIVEMNRYLNELTGGKEYISGKGDFNPDPYYYLMLSLLGGAGKFTGDVVDLSVTGAAVVNNAINETDDNVGFLEALVKTEKPIIRRNEIPFAKIILGEASRFYDYDMFDQNRLDVEQHLAQAKAYMDGEDVNVDGVDFTGVQDLEDTLKNTTDMLSQIREARRNLRQSDLDYIKKNNLLYMLEEEEKKTLVYFNAKYYELRGQYINPRPHGLIPEMTVRQALGRE